jgi:hypothetical protein
MPKVERHSFTDCPYDCGNIENRSFSPGFSRLDGIPVELHQGAWTFVCCSSQALLLDGIVIAADDVYNGFARNLPVGIGVFVGNGSRFNHRDQLPPSNDHRPDSSKFEAGIVALKTVLDIAAASSTDEPGGSGSGQGGKNGGSGGLRQVVIKTHSWFFERGITEWIHRYRRNNFHGRDGEPLFNGELWRELDALVHDLKKMGMTVHF